MRIKLKNNWMGHKKGITLDLTEAAANRLISMGTAKAIIEKPKAKGGEVKEISSPPKDKMLKRPVRKKAI